MVLLEQLAQMEPPDHQEPPEHLGLLEPQEPPVFRSRGKDPGMVLIHIMLTMLLITTEVLI